MDRMRKLALTMALVIGVSTVTWAAPVYKDVPSWGQAAVQKVVDKGLMAGNSSGQFFPNQVVTKFQLVEVLARIAGYKDPIMDSTITLAEKQYNENAYNKYKGVLNKASQNFSGWESAKNHRIAYLLQKGIFEERDLNRFVNNKGVAQPVTREELAIYLVRLLGKEQEALAEVATTGFSDDGAFNDTIGAKSYVAYLKKVGLVQGDTNNQYNPQVSVNRVTLAVFLANTLDYIEKDAVVNTTQEEMVAGSIKNVQHIRRGFLVITNYKGQDLMYTLPTDLQIFNHGSYLTAQQLKEGMQISAKVRDGKSGMKEVFWIQVLVDPTSTASHSSTTIVPSNKDKVQTQTLHGIVQRIRQDSDYDVITITQQVLLWGRIQEEEKTFYIAKDAELRSDDNKILGVREIRRGDIIEAEVDISTLYKGRILSREREVTGIIVDRQQVDGKQTISVETTDKRIETYKITKNSEIYKRRHKRATWSDLRIGDEVTVEVDYDEVIEINAEGWKERVRGVIESIVIAPTSKITIKDRDDKEKEYVLLPSVSVSNRRGDVSSIYDLRLGYEVEISLESEEIDRIDILDYNTQTTFQGTIEEVKEDGDVILVEIDQSNSDYPGYIHTFYLTSNTKIYRRSDELRRKDLRRYWDVLIYTRSDGKTVETIHILR